MQIVALLKQENYSVVSKGAFMVLKNLDSKSHKGKTKFTEIYCNGLLLHS